MKSVTSTTLTGFALVAVALLACGGKAAVEDLEKLKDKTCSCKDDQKCVEEAKTMAREWVTKHKDARGGDAKKAEDLMQEILACNTGVGLELAKAVEAAQ